MRDELDERFLHELSHLRVRRHHVHRAVEREHRRELRHLKYLPDHPLATKPRQAFVPDFCQQLLHVRMGDKLLLLIFDRELQSLQGLPLARLPILPRRIEVQHNFQLVAGPRVIQQWRRELLRVLSHDVVFRAEFRLHAR